MDAFRGDFAARSGSRHGVVGAAAGELAESRRRCASAGRCELITALGEAGVATLGAGWSEPECGGVWSDGPLAILHLPVLAREQWRVVLRAQPYGKTDHDRLFTLRTPAGVVARHVYLGGTLGGAVLECVLEGSGPLAIDMPWVISPATLGYGDDHPRLGIYLHHVSMTRRAAWPSPRVKPLNCTGLS